MLGTFPSGIPFWETGVSMQSWHLLQASSLSRLARRDPLIFVPLVLAVGLLLAPRQLLAEDLPKYELTVQHANQARIFVHTIDDAPRAVDFAPQLGLTRIERPTRWPGWLMLGSGLVATGVGAALAISAAQDGVALRQQVLANPLQYAAPASQQQVADQAASLSNQLTVGAAVAGTGVVVSVIGTWLLLRDPTRRAAVVPTGQGALLVTAF